MLNTRIGENFNANDVINSNDLRKRLLNIDSRFRTNLSDLSTSFQYRCEHTYKNIIRVRLASIEIPNMFYTFSAAKANTSFIVSTRDITGITRTVRITIPDGNYIITDLVNTIQAQFDTLLKAPYGIFLTITFDIITTKITISHNGLAPYPVTLSTTVPSADADSITINFQPTTPKENLSRDRNYGCGIGYHLGYRQRLFNLVTPTSFLPIKTYALVGTAVVDMAGDTYCFLEVNDYHAVEHNTIEKYFQCFAKIMVREDKGAVIYDDGSTTLSNEIIFPSPVDLTTLAVRLIDPWGDIINLNGLDLSFTLEITEVANTTLYDFYRNYIWLGTIPSVPRNVRGSAVGLLGGRGP
jgi:hypothetical protein